MTWYEWLIVGGLYLVCGQLFSLAYILNYKPKDRTAMLGLMGLCWPVVLILDLVLQVAAGFGGITKAMVSKVEKPKEVVNVRRPGT